MPKKISVVAGPIVPAAGTAEGLEVKRQEAILKTGALQNAILNSANFSSIATDEKGVIQIFNVGAERPSLSTGTAVPPRLRKPASSSGRPGGADNSAVGRISRTASRGNAHRVSAIEKTTIRRDFDWSMA